MKKIMFNDKYGLTKAVIERRKTVTRRIIDVGFDSTNSDEPYPFPKVIEYTNRDGEKCISFDMKGFDWNPKLFLPKYKVGEILAVAQSYATIEKTLGDHYIPSRIKRTHPGWNNKMFVLPDAMPYQIRITNIHYERLQDITSEDCIKEGIVESYVCGHDGCSEMKAYRLRETDIDSHIFATEAFSELIDKVSGKGMWKKNPMAIRYEFELIK